jgi:hypothetical protein
MFSIGLYNNKFIYTGVPGHGSTPLHIAFGIVISNALIKDKLWALELSIVHVLLCLFSSQNPHLPTVCLPLVCLQHIDEAQLSQVVADMWAYPEINLDPWDSKRDRVAYKAIRVSLGEPLQLGILYVENSVANDLNVFEIARCDGCVQAWDRGQ